MSTVPGRGIENARRRDRSELATFLCGVGLIAMPAGLVVVGLGWWGASRTRYEWDQISYLISGGLLGLAITCAGGLTAAIVTLVRIHDALEASIWADSGRRTGLRDEDEDRNDHSSGARQPGGARPSDGPG